MMMVDVVPEKSHAVFLLNFRNARCNSTEKVRKMQGISCGSWCCSRTGPQRTRPA